MGKKRPKKKLQELNLLDDFLMNQMVAHPVYGESFCRSILEIILHRSVGSLEIVSQKSLYGTDTGKHGIRLDVYVKERDGKIIDLEAEHKKSRAQSLPRRARFYHSKLDAETFPSGSDYYELMDVYVIFISDFDPFGLGQMVYTISSRCEEFPDLPYDDGAKTLFLNTKGTPDKATGNLLQELLAYMEYSDSSHALCDELQSIHRMVEAVKQDREVGFAYMKSWEIERELKEEGFEVGRMDMLIELVADGVLTVEEAAKKTGMNANAIRQGVHALHAKEAPPHH